MPQSKAERRRLGRETVEILEQGFYAVDGARVELADQMTKAVDSTVEYPNSVPPPSVDASGDYTTVIEVVNAGTLSAASRLAQQLDVAVLNFASAKNPGGGFLNGSRAQEESLAMSSGLYPCLLGREMYDFHRPTRGGMYTPWVVYSPAVPVIRNDDGVLLSVPYSAAFLTSPAVNARAVRKHRVASEAEILRQMAIRVDKVLSVAAHHGHAALILGAWGCGVFGNDPGDIANLFGNALAGRFAGVFQHVVFAVLDRSHERRFIKPFENRFG